MPTGSEHRQTAGCTGMGGEDEGGERTNQEKRSPTGLQTFSRWHFFYLFIFLFCCCSSSSSSFLYRPVHAAPIVRNFAAPHRRRGSRAAKFLATVFHIGLRATVPIVCEIIIIIITRITP